MWPFEQGENLPDVDRLDLEGRWANLRIENDDRPGYVRVNEGLAEVARHPAYDYEVKLSISYENVRADGLPSLPEEMRAVDAIEGDVRARLEAGRQSLLAVVVTRDGVREMTFYTRNPSGVASWFEQQKQSPLTHRLEILIRPDPQWGAFRTYTNAV
jgi:hypothetical protein